MSVSGVENISAVETAGAGPAGGRMRVLFVSYAFPPVGGAGVQRTTKFIKYLGGAGWEASVLTVANPSVPAMDESLLADVPKNVVVRRARTMEPGYGMKNAVAAGEGRRGGWRQAVKGIARGVVKMALQPDPQVLWTRGAVREGKRLLGEMRHDVIVVSGPPFSSFRIGAKLSRWAGIPLVLDYRDEWDLSNAYLENKRLDGFSLRLQRGMQRRVVRAAALLVATTKCSAAALERVRDEAGAGARVACIYNGYDPEDFAGAVARGEGEGVFRLAYVGTLWNLTSVGPVVEAVERLCERSPELAGRLELVFVGRRTPAQQALLDRLRGKACRLVEHPYLPHDEALALVRGSDGLCVLLSDLPGAGRVVPAKLFEYMAAGRTIVGVAPRGEMWELLDGYPAARLHEPGDVEGIAASLAGEIERRMRGETSRVEGFDATRFSRPAQAGQLARLLAGVVEGVRR